MASITSGRNKPGLCPVVWNFQIERTVKGIISGLKLPMEFQRLAETVKDAFRSYAKIALWSHDLR